jgi:hypothetical protein
MACGDVHADDDPCLGEPICAQCFDHEGAVIWNNALSELWRYTTIYLPRIMARRVCMTQKDLKERLRFSYGGPRTRPAARAGRRTAPMPGRDTRTRFQGVFARHQEACRVTETGDPKTCTCSPSYYGAVWDRTAHKYRKTRRFKGVIEARNARLDLMDAVRAGRLAEGSGPPLAEARTEFIGAAREGVALNKWGRPYRRRAVEDSESALRHVPESLARRQIGEIGRGDLQRLVDDLTRRGLSGSRIRSVVNAVRSLYRWAQDRDLVAHNPAELCDCRRWTRFRAIASRRRASSRRCSRFWRWRMHCSMRWLATARRATRRFERSTGRMSI